MGKIRILHLISTIAFLGAERVLSEICTCADRERFEVSIGVIQGEHDIAKIFQETIRNEKVEINTFFCRKQFDIQCLKAIREYIKKNKITVIHSHGYKSNFYAFIASLFCNEKTALLATNHLWKDTSVKEKIYKYFDICILHFFDKIIAVSTGIRDEMTRIGFNNRKVIVIDNGINVNDDDFFTSREEARRLLQLDNKCLVVGCVGSLTPEKGHKDILHALQYLNANNDHPLKIVIVGDGPELKNLNKIIAENNFEKIVFLAGQKKDARKLYSAFDVFLLPSYIEGLPMVMLEAMASSVPIVASSVGGIPIVITNGKNGLLTKPGDVQDIADKLNTLLCDNEQRAKLAEQGRKTVEQNYSSLVMTNRYEEIYNQLC